MPAADFPVRVFGAGAPFAYPREARRIPSHIPQKRIRTMPEDIKTYTAELRTETGGVQPVPVFDAATEAVLDADGVGVRAPSCDDGARIWEMARDAGTLDLNSPYAYMLMCRDFPHTCAIAEVYGRPAGFVIAHRVPARPDVLFIWQIAVLPDFRGLGIAGRMLDDLLARDANAGVRTLEATVTPSNAASGALFRSFAKSRGAALAMSPCFAAGDFPGGLGHEAEELFTITPVAPVA